MKHRRIWQIIACALAALALLGVFTAANREPLPQPGSNTDNYVRLLSDLVTAYETPSAGDARRIAADLEAIRLTDSRDYATAAAIAEHWQKVFLDPDYTLFLYHGEGAAPELAGAGIPNSRSHAIVVLGYELMDGQMQQELKDRCEAAAAMAGSFPETILVCSGGATGPNNPGRNTEAGLMKQYLTEECGVEPSRIFIDERAMTTAENALNTLAILKEKGVHTMTIVTSSYHQRWGQALYNLVAELYRQDEGYVVEIVGNYSCDREPTVAIYALGDRIAARQIAGILGLPREAIDALPPY